MESDNLKDYFMDELWPLLTDEQRRQFFELASLLARYASPPKSDGEGTDKED